MSKQATLSTEKPRGMYISVAGRPPVPMTCTPQVQSTLGTSTLPCGTVVPTLVMYYPDDDVESTGQNIAEHAGRDERGFSPNLQLIVVLIDRGAAMVTHFKVINSLEPQAPVLIHAGIAYCTADEFAAIADRFSRVGMCLVTLMPSSSFDPDAPSLPLNKKYTWWTRRIEAIDESEI